jgi:hypothetical protein
LRKEISHRADRVELFCRHGVDELHWREMELCDVSLGMRLEHRRSIGTEPRTMLIDSGWKQKGVGPAWQAPKAGALARVFVTRPVSAVTLALSLFMVVWPLARRWRLGQAGGDA